MKAYPFRFQFKEISFAYEILSNPEKKSLYDRAGLDAIKEGGAGGWLRARLLYSRAQAYHYLCSLMCVLHFSPLVSSPASRVHPRYSSYPFLLRLSPRAALLHVRAHLRTKYRYALMPFFHIFLYSEIVFLLGKERAENLHSN